MGGNLKNSELSTKRADLEARIKAFAKAGRISEEDKKLGYLARSDLFWALAPVLEELGELQQAAYAWYEASKGVAGGNGLPDDPDRAHDHGWRSVPRSPRDEEAFRRYNAVLDRIGRSMK